MPDTKPEQVVVLQKDREAMLLNSADHLVLRKTARIIAVRMDKPFLVYTEHGPIAGEAGDWLATNHPDDDPGSDIWPISAARMGTTYELVT
jgi:hypothetical protein